MTDDPRVGTLIRWAPYGEAARAIAWADSLMAALDAVDPLRQPVSGNGLPDRLRSTTELMANVASVPMAVWNRHSNTCLEAASEIERLRALAAADRVQAAAHEVERPDSTPWLWQTANLLKRVAREMEQTLRARDRQHQADDVHDLRRAAFPETKDAG